MFPTPQQFTLDLTTIYFASTEQPLSAKYQKQFIDMFTSFFADEFPIHLPHPSTRTERFNLKLKYTAKAYHLFLRTCAQSLIGFTRAAPPLCLQQPEQRVLLTEAKNLYFEIVDLDDGEESLRPAAQVAFQALCTPFRQMRAELEEAGLFEWSTFLPNFIVPKPDIDPGDFSDHYRVSWTDATDAVRNSWNRRIQKYNLDLRKNREKALREAYANQTVFEAAVLGTPFYRQAYNLYPNEIVHIPFNIDPLKWFETTWIIASQGRGKSNLLRHLILHHLPDACVIIMDAKGDLIETFSKHEPIKDRLVILEPDPLHPIAINPLDIGHSDEFIEYIFELLNTEMSVHQATLLYYTILLCKEIPSASLETFRDILQNGWRKYENFVRQLKQRDQDFFDKSWDDTLYKPRRPEVLARLRALMKTPAIDAILQCPRTQIDISTLMDNKKIVLVNNNYEKLGDKGSELLGRLFIALVWAAARKRSLHHGEKTPVFFFIDEAHWVIANDTKISTIIQQCRSQKIALVLAHQELQSIKNPDVKASLFNAAIKFANPTGEAAQLADKFRTDADFLEQQRLGTFAAWVLDKTPKAVQIEVPRVAGPDNALFDYPRLSDEQYRAILKRSRDNYCYAPQHEPPAPKGPAPKATLVPTDEVEDF